MSKTSSVFFPNLLKPKAKYPRFQSKQEVKRFMLKQKRNYASSHLVKDTKNVFQPFNVTTTKIKFVGWTKPGMLHFANRNVSWMTLIKRPKQNLRIFSAVIQNGNQWNLVFFCLWWRCVNILSYSKLILIYFKSAENSGNNWASADCVWPC